jgi:hypothetical protein
MKLYTSPQTCYRNTLRYTRDTRLETRGKWIGAVESGMHDTWKSHFQPSVCITTESLHELLKNKKYWNNESIDCQMNAVVTLFIACIKCMYKTLELR